MNAVAISPTKIQQWFNWSGAEKRSPKGEELGIDFSKNEIILFTVNVGVTDTSPRFARTDEGLLNLLTQLRSAGMDVPADEEFLADVVSSVEGLRLVDQDETLTASINADEEQPILEEIPETEVTDHGKSPIVGDSSTKTILKQVGAFAGLAIAGAVVGYVTVKAIQHFFENGDVIATGEAVGEAVEAADTVVNAIAGFLG